MDAPTYADLAELVDALGRQLSALNEKVLALEETNQALTIEVVALRAENATLRARVVELETQVGTNSKNSSTPPSADGLGKPAPKSLRKPSGRKPGGQGGHPGKTLTQVAHPDVVVRHEPPACSGCGAGLGGAPQTGVTRRQVFDLPPIELTVTEHQLISRRCTCGTITRGPAPDLVGAPVQYGPVACAIMVYLFHGQFLSRARTADALSELFNAPVSAATVAAATTRAAAGLGPFLQVVAAHLTGAPVLHVDETGLRCEGRLAWLHSASTDAFTLLYAHPGRGRVAMDAMGVLPTFTGTLVHDAFAPYDQYTGATHSLCGAHLLRELVAVTDHHHRGRCHHGGIPRWCWAGQVTDALLALTTATAAGAGATQISAEVLRTQAELIRHGALIGEHTDPVTKVDQKHRALARRILKRADDYLRFATDPAVPFTNNAAEQTIRMAKIRLKVSGCMRTLAGAKEFAAIRSYTATATKHGLTTLDALTRLSSGNTWYPATT
jgi:transposase